MGKVIFGLLLFAGAAYLYNEGEKTAWASVLGEAKTADQKAEFAMRGMRPDQIEIVLEGVRKLNHARLKPDKTPLFGNPDTTKVKVAINDLYSAIIKAQAAPRPTAPPARRSDVPPGNTGCFDRYGPIPGC